MKSGSELESVPLSEVRNWLQVAHHFPGRYQAVLEKARHDSGAWIPKLAHLATRENTKAGRQAVRVLTDLVIEAQGLEMVYAIYQHLPRRTSALAGVALQIGRAHV